MKVLITGGSGFVGSATRLQYPDVEWFNYDIMEGYDIRDIEQLERVAKEFKPDRILHLAAIARFSECDNDPVLGHSTNVVGTFNVAEVADQFHIPIVYASTGSVYMPIQDEPPITEEFPVRGNSVYGVTKMLGEHCILETKNPYIILRYAHLFGREKRYHGLIGGFLSRIERGLAPELYGGKQSNDFVYIEDVARANLLALRAPWDKWHQVYNIGTGEELSAEKAGRLVCQHAGYSGDVAVKDARTVDAQRFVYDTTKAENMLGFTASYTFEAGLKDMLDDKN